MSKPLKYSLLSLIVILVLGGSAYYAFFRSSNFNDGGYSFDSAIINYVWTGATEGKETIMIKGRKSRSETSINRIINGETVKQKTIAISDGEKLYTIDEDRGLAIEAKSPYQSDFSSMSNDQINEERLRMILQLKEGEEIPKPEGKNTIAGFECDVYSVNFPESTCIWEGLVLANEISVGNGKAKKEAVTVQIDLAIDDSFFELPEGVKVLKESEQTQ